MNKTLPSNFLKLDLSPEKLAVTKIPQINMNFESTQLLSDRDLHGGETAVEKGPSEVATLLDAQSQNRIGQIDQAVTPMTIGSPMKSQESRISVKEI